MGDERDQGVGDCVLVGVLVAALEGSTAMIASWSPWSTSTR